MIKNLPFKECKHEIKKISNEIKKETETLLQRIRYFQQQIDKCKTKAEIEEIMLNYDMEEDLVYIRLDGGDN